MGWTDSKRREALVLLSELCMVYGISVFYEYSGSSLSHKMPPAGELVPADWRRAAAEKSVNALATKRLKTIRSACRLLSKLNRDYEMRGGVLDSLNEKALDSARVEAMVPLFQNGLDDHPLFTALAKADSMSEVKRISAKATTLYGRSLVTAEGFRYSPSSVYPLR